MRIEVRDGPESRPEVAPLAAVVYPPEVLATVVWRDVVSAKATRRVMVYEDVTLVATVGLHFRAARVDDSEVSLAGIGGVMTLPSAQRRGFGKAAMVAAHMLIARESEAAFGVLFCEPKNFGFYTSLGWSHFRGTVIAEQPDRTGPYEVMSPMTRPFQKEAPLSGTIDLQGLPW